MRDMVDSSHVPGTQGCHATRLAQSELVVVDRCSCGTVSVHLGPMTLRVHAQGLCSIVETLAEALRAHAHSESDAHAAGAALAAALGHAKAPRGQS